MRFPRCGGILLHLTSLPSRQGIGDLGQSAYQFAEFLAASGQSLWQVLPLAPTGYGDSPYQCFSAFAGNPLLISPQRLVRAGLLSEEDISQAPPFPEERIDFGRVIEYKRALFDKAFSNCNRSAEETLRSRFVAFCREAEPWLEDYALFRALKSSHGGVAWIDWEPRFAMREQAALDEARQTLAHRIELEKLLQFLFFEQWLGL